MGTNGARGVFASSASGTGAALSGASAGGYGLSGQGGLAPLYLAPAGTAGAPTTGTHQQGELYADSAGALFYCTAGGTPGTWKTVTLT